MSNEFNKLLLEMARQVIREEEPADSKLDPTKDSNIDNVKNIKLNGLSVGDAAILDVNAIARALIVGTESSQRDSMSIKDAFDSIRGTNGKALDELEQAQQSSVPSAILDVLRHYFIPPTESVDSTCRDLSTMFTRHIILSAYSLIFKEYAASPAGFVNESFLAGLLGGGTIKAAGSETIADMQLQNNRIGISLKTAASTGKLSGSFSNLMRTLGIEYRVVGKGSAYASKGGKAMHVDGLFYLLFNKTSKTSHKISCFRVDKEGIIGSLNEHLASESTGLSRDKDGTYVFNSLEDYNRLKGGFAGLLGIKFDSIINDKVVGIADYQSIEQDIDLQAQVTEGSSETNVKKIIETLNLLNKFYSIYYNAVIAFASNPSGENLEKIKTELVSMSAIDPKNLVISNNCN